MGLGDYVGNSSSSPDSEGSVQQSQGSAQAAQAGSTNSQPGGIYGTGLPTVSSIMSQIFGQGNTITGPNAAAYNQQMNQAGNEGSYYNGLAAGPNAYTQRAPTINNPYAAADRSQLATDQTRQQGLAGYLDQTMAGKGPAIQGVRDQYQQSQDQSIAANLAMANSTRGGPAALAGAQRMAQQQNAQTLAGAAAQSGITTAQQEQAAAGQLGGVLGTQQQGTLTQTGMDQVQPYQQAQLDAQNQAQQNAMQLGFGGLGVQQQNLGEQALSAYTTQSLQQQQLQLQANQAASFLGQLGIAGGSSAISGAMGSSGGGGGGESSAGNGGEAAGMGGDVAMMSDRRVKSDVHDEGPHDSLVEDFLRKMDPKSFRYRAGLDPSAAPTGGRRLGVMAQDMERSDMGRAIVRETPKGKAIDVRGAAGASLAGLANLDERMRALEAKRGKR